MRAAFIFQIGLLKKRARGDAAPSKAPTRSRSSGAEPGPETRRGSFSPLGCAAPPPKCQPRSSRHSARASSCLPGPASRPQSRASRPTPPVREGKRRLLERINKKCVFLNTLSQFLVPALRGLQTKPLSPRVPSRGFQFVRRHSHLSFQPGSPWLPASLLLPSGFPWTTCPSFLLFPLRMRRRRGEQRRPITSLVCSRLAPDLWKEAEEDGEGRL